MRCYNPLYRLYDVLHQGEDTGNLIAMVESSDNVVGFTVLIVGRLQSGHYPWAESQVAVEEAATAFAEWWSSK